MGKAIKPDTQQLLKNAGIFKPILQFIKYDVEAKGAENQKDKSELKLLQTCYKFLALFCYQNQDNISQVESYLPYFLKHVQEKQLSLSYLLIKEIYRNQSK